MDAFFREARLQRGAHADSAALGTSAAPEHEEPLP